MDSNQILHCNICTHLYSDKREEFFLNNWSQYTLISSLGISKPCCLFNPWRPLVCMYLWPFYTQNVKQKHVNLYIVSFKKKNTNMIFCICSIS
jgi:hypothetical protein